MQYGTRKFSYKSGVKKVEKRCCPVAKPRQHTNKKSDRHCITFLPKMKQEFDEMIKDCNEFFGYNPRLFEHLASNVRMYAEQGK